MNWTRSLVATAAVALACFAAHGVAHASTDHTGSKSATVIADGSDYTISTKAAGSGMSVAISVSGAYHINKDYPVKFEKKPVDKANITYGAGDAPTGVTVNIPGSQAGTIKFGYCASDGSACKFGEVAVHP